MSEQYYLRSKLNLCLEAEEAVRGVGVCHALYGA